MLSIKHFQTIKLFKMKHTILILAMLFIVFGTFFNSCKSPAEKVEDAQNKVQDAKADLKTVIKDSLTVEQKAANAEEWKIFRNESQVKIKNNEIRIDALKSKIKREGSNDKAENEGRIDSLEIKNMELVTRMDNYEKGKSNWETFKLEFNRDLDGLGESLKKFTIRNKGKK